MTLDTLFALFVALPLSALAVALLMLARLVMEWR